MRAIPVRRVVSPGNFSKACNNEKRDLLKAVVITNT